MCVSLSILSVFNFSQQFPLLLIYNETYTAYIGFLVVDNQNKHCLIIYKYLLFYLQDRVKGLWCAWINFCSSNLESCNILSCTHFDQDYPKLIWIHHNKVFFVYSFAGGTEDVSHKHRKLFFSVGVLHSLYIVQLSDKHETVL